MEVDWLLPNARDRERWREGRRLADRGFRSGAISLNHQTIEEKTRWFLDQLLATPAEFRDHIELSVVLFVRSCFAGNSIMVVQISSESHHVLHVRVRPERERRYNRGTSAAQPSHRSFFLP